MAKVQPFGDSPGQPDTGSAATIGIHIEDTVFVDFSTGNGREHFVKDHVELGKLLQMLCCPCCCLYLPWAGKKNHMEYYRDCGLCACPYAVKLNGLPAGKVHDVGCCDNGLLFCCCPICTCSDHIKVMGMDGSDGKEKFVFTKSLFPCWPVVECCALGCAPLGAMCLMMNGCIKYCQQSEIQTITQPVFKGPWTRGDGKPQQIGNFVITNRFQPSSCCCATPTPLKYYFKPSTPEGAKLIDTDLTALALTLQLYRGLPVPCKCCSPAGFQMPTGVPCLDIGLQTTRKWNTVREVMLDSD